MTTHDSKSSEQLLAEGNPAGRLKMEKKFDYNGYFLTPTWHKFISIYLDPASKGYLNGTETIYQMGKTPKTRKYAKAMASNITNKPEVMRCLRDRLIEGDVTDLIERGIRANLKKHEKTDAWVKVARYASEIRGDFAPVTTINMNLTPADRQKEYDEILHMIEGDPNGDKLQELHGVCDNAPALTSETPNEEDDSL